MNSAQVNKVQAQPTDLEQVEEFNRMFRRRMFDISEPLFHSWLSLKFASERRGGNDVSIRPSSPSTQVLFVSVGGREGGQGALARRGGGAHYGSLRLVVEAGNEKLQQMEDMITNSKETNDTSFSQKSELGKKEIKPTSWKLLKEKDVVEQKQLVHRQKWRGRL